MANVGALDPESGAAPDVAALARALLGSDSAPRVVKQLHRRLSGLDPDAPLEARVDELEQLARWVVAGPSVPASLAGREHPATARLELLLRALDAAPRFRAALSRALSSVLAESDAHRLLCDVGLPSDRGLLSETSDRLARRFLPSPPDPRDLAERVAHVFRKQRDAAWLYALPAETLSGLHQRLGDVWQPLRSAAQDALALLSTRVSALGLSEDLRRRGSGGSVRSSPFFRLPRAPAEQLPDLILACRAELSVVLLNLERFGVSVDVVYRLDVIAKSLDRIEAVLVALDPSDAPEVVKAESGLLAELVRARLREQSVRDVLRANTRLLSRKIIERAGHTGEHYITATRREWWLMLASASGGGFLTVFTTVLKFMVKWGHFAPAIEGVLASLNYAVSFVVVQLLGCTLATKQPSMTAASLAGAIRDQADEHQLDDLVTTIARVCRSQLAAAVGNVAVVVPCAVLFDLAHSSIVGRPYLDADTARYTVSSFHPLASGSLLFAALTGVLLWASSIAAGWLENFAVYRQLPEAIADHRLKRFLGRGLTGGFSRYFAKHVAGIGGNVSLGFLLGMTPALGQFFGLPLEVRHVTLAAGSLALGARSLGAGALLEPAMLWAAAGIVGIGAINLFVSFSMALAVAFRAREVPLRRGFRLALGVLARLVASPLEFVYPPANESGEAFAHRPSMTSRLHVSRS